MDSLGWNGRNSDALVRRRAVLLIGTLAVAGDAAAVATLVASLADASEDVRQAAVLRAGS
eukprot:526111-Amphidinium_carterae.2